MYIQNIVQLHKCNELIVNKSTTNIMNNDFKTYNSGDHISIEYGSLEGLKGQVIEVKNNKIYIQIDGLSAKVSIEYNG